METVYSQLEDAIDKNDTAFARSLLAQNPHLLQESKYANYFLNHAAGQGKIEMMSLLASFGADINAPGGHNLPEGPIYRAAGDGVVNSVRWLLDHGAAVNHQLDGQWRCFPLTSAVRGGHLEVVKLLVERGAANVNAIWGGNTPLNHAIMCGHKEIENYLRSMGALEPAQLMGSNSMQHHGTATVLDHIEKHLGKPEALALRQVVSDVPVIAIHVVRQPHQLVLVTVGMSDRPMTVPRGAENYQYAELVIYLPPDWPVGDKRGETPNHAWPTEWLMNVARYPRDNHTRLGGPSVVIANGEPPEPLAPNTLLTSLLLLAEKGDFGKAKLADGRTVQFYSVYPLYTEERDLEKEKGTEALIELFMKYRVSPIVDIRRINVARASGYRGRGHKRL